MPRIPSRWVLSLLVGCLSVHAAAAQTPPQRLNYSRDIQPILSNNCFSCHGPDADERKGGNDGLRLDTPAGAAEDLGGHRAIEPGNPDKSEVVRRIGSTDDDERMPPPETGKKLTAEEIALLTEWIRQGGEYTGHWAYIKPVRPVLPAVENRVWPRNAIDYFVLARLEREGLRPAPEADRYALIRRVSLDLTGLPPTVAEAEAFAHDADPQAYEKLVDRLLQSSAYGEYWARSWLDLARYADSAGYADDPPRTIWLYRDYVIRSYNDNKPFDQFTVEQIAGDLLPDPTPEQLTATAFHRNTQTNNEGGTNDEEFRNVAIVDRVNTTLAVWMGTTIACAQCHNHKFDPITQQEYFRLFAFFNNTEDADRRDESPLLSVFSDEQQHLRGELERELASLNETLRGQSPEQAATRKRIEELTRQLAEIKPQTVPIQRELAADKRRATKIQHRGSFLDVGDEVSEGTPQTFPPLPTGAPVDRLALARWLVDDDNPLTARVIANRYWEQLFGIGIVASSEDFGSRGDLPSHSELLDALATELVRSGWDAKAFLRLLVTSAAYRQSSRVTPELEQRDPDNRLLARGPRVRLSAETIRDQALFVAGLLSTKLYGPPVNPPQPTVGLSAAFGGGIDWQTSPGEDRYRRAIYTTWRRSNPYPSMTTFDAPNRETCTLHRSRTNTPLQALVTLNDPVYVEAAQALARRIVREGGATAEDRASFGLRICLLRDGKPAEVARLAQLYERSRSRFANSPDEAKRLATDPLGPLPAGMVDGELAAWTVVANVLLNLDETLMKR
ncbi:MAG: PSD1 and planctomycete cytochrome C domain-containing protein [Pirellulales bacterium]